MLRYLGHGSRQFGLRPVYIHRRANWEFFVVLSGRCGPLFEEEGVAQLASARMWVFPPQTAHGWAGSGSSTCDVGVFHYAAVPEPLERSVGEGGFIAVDLTPPQVRSLRKLVAELKPHVEKMTARSILVFQRALIDLSLIALDAVAPNPREIRSDFAMRKTESVLAWFADHMQQKPKLEAAAQAESLSVRHLRRLFQEARGESPQKAFTRLRVQRAMELLAQSERKLEDIVEVCGFSSSSDFCRVFKAWRGLSPHRWRQEVLRSCNERQAATPLRSDLEAQLTRSEPAR